MARFTSLFLFYLGLISFTHAQYKSDNLLLSGGISMARYGNYAHDWSSEYNYDQSGLIPIWLQIESGAPENWNLGDYQSNFTYGCFLGTSSFNYEKNVVYMYNSYNVYKKYFYLDFGGMLAFHYVPLLKEIDLNLDPSVFDFYLSMKAGFVYNRFKSNFDDDPLDPSVPLGMVDNKSSKFYLTLAPQLGFRYSFYPKWSAMAEIGYFNVSFLSLGLSYKLK